MMVLIIGMAAVMLAMYFPSQGTEGDDNMYEAAMEQEGGAGYLSMKSMDALQMGLVLSTATPGLTLLDPSIWQARNPTPARPLLISFINALYSIQKNDCISSRDDAPIMHYKM